MIMTILHPYYKIMYLVISTVCTDHVYPCTTERLSYTENNKCIIILYILLFRAFIYFHRISNRHKKAIPPDR